MSTIVPGMSTPETPKDEENPYLKLLEPAIETTKALLQPWGPVEAGLNLATQTYGLPASGLAGLAGLPFGKSRQWSEAANKALVYEPQTEEGKRVTGAINVPFEYLGRASEKASDAMRTGQEGRPTAATFPWMGEAKPFGEVSATEAEKAMSGTVAGTSVMAAPLLLGAKKLISPESTPRYSTLPPGLQTGLRTTEPNPYLDLLTSERGSLGPAEQAKVASLRRQVSAISKSKPSIPQIDGLKYEGIQDLSRINEPNQYVFTDTKTGSTFSTTDLSKANLESNRDRIRTKFAEYRTPKYSIGDAVKTKDFEGVVAEINDDGSLLVGNKSGKMKEIRPMDILKEEP